MRKSSSSYQQQGHPQPPPPLQPGQGGYAPPPFKQQMQQRMPYPQAHQGLALPYQKGQQFLPLKQQQQQPQQPFMRGAAGGIYPPPQTKVYRGMPMGPGGHMPPMGYGPNVKQGAFMQKSQPGPPPIHYNPQKFQYTPQQQEHLMGKAMSQKNVPNVKGFDKSIPSKKEREL